MSDTYILGSKDGRWTQLREVKNSFLLAYEYLAFFVGNKTVTINL